MTFEVDSDEFGKFNKDNSGRETTLDKTSMKVIADMALDAQRGQNDLLNEAKLVSVGRGNVVGGVWREQESWNR